MGNTRIFIRHRPYLQSWRQKNIKDQQPWGFFTEIFRDPRRPADSQEPPLTEPPLVLGLDRQLYHMTLLSRVCRQFYQETAFLPYLLNVWSFENEEVMKAFIIRDKRITERHRRAIHTLWVRSYDFVSRAVQKQLCGVELLLVADYNGDIKKRRMKPLEARPVLKGDRCNWFERVGDSL